MLDIYNRIKIPEISTENLDPRQNIYFLGALFLRTEAEGI
jgi:hypothetical protein